MRSLNEAVLNNFYSAFAEKDVDTMLSYYTEGVVFFDPVFGDLFGDEVRTMWRTLIERGGEDLEISHKILSANDDGGQVEWIARYKFGPKKRPVVNKITAVVWIKEGKIYQHEDYFDFWKWSRQALGLSGSLLGWSGYLRKKVRAMARRGLEKSSK